MKKAIIRAKQQNIDWKKECEKQYIELIYRNTELQKQCTEIMHRNIELQQKIKEQKQKIIEQGFEIKELEALAAGYYCDNYGGDEALGSLKRAEKALEEYKQKYGQKYGLEFKFN